MMILTTLLTRLRTSSPTSWLFTVVKRDYIYLLLLITFLPGAYLLMGTGVAHSGAHPLEVDTADRLHVASASQAAQPVIAEGTLEPRLYTTLSFQEAGRVAQVPVKVGDIVEAGEPLVLLDSVDAELAVQRAQQRLATAETALSIAQSQLQMAHAEVTTAQGQVTVAQAGLNLVQSGARPEEVAAAEARLAAANSAVAAAVAARDATLNGTTTSAILAAETNLALVTATRNAVEEQYQQVTTCYEQADGGQNCPYLGPVEERTRAQLAAARMNETAAIALLDELRAGPTSSQRQAADAMVAAAIANRNIAQAELNLLLAAATPEEVAYAAVAVQRAEINVRLAGTAVQQAEAAVARAEAQVAGAQVAVDAAEAALEQMILRAPIEGVVTQLDAHPGEIVLGGSPVVTLVEQSGWVVRTSNLTQLDVIEIAPGSAAYLTLDAIPGERLTGTVASIGLEPGVKEREVVYEVIIQLDPAVELPLRWGMTALVEIVSQ